jgi:copper(I)-binding protein
MQAAPQRHRYNVGQFFPKALSMSRLIAVLATALLAPAAHACELALVDGWVRTAPPTAKVMAGFGTLRNPGTVESKLVSVTSPQFGRVELHEMSMDGGVMKMRALESVKVEAGESVALAPGGTHLMLFDPVAPLASGDPIEVKLTLACDSEYKATLTVAERAPTATEASEDTHEHHHGGH